MLDCIWWEREKKRMTPRFSVCSTVWLVLFGEFRTIERTRFGEKNRTPLGSTASGELYNTGVLEKITDSILYNLGLRCL